MYVATERLFVNRTLTKIVPGNSTEAAFILCGPGTELDDATARRYGLIPAPAKAVTTPVTPEPPASPPVSAPLPSLATVESGPPAQPDPEPAPKRTATK